METACRPRPSRVVAARLEPLIEANPGLLLERKTASVALHYRQRPELGALCAEAVQAATADMAELSVLPGKMVYEVRPQGADKGTAVEAFLGEAPFAGRVPVYIGDDFTDEHAFAAVNARGRRHHQRWARGRRSPNTVLRERTFYAWCAAQSAPGEGGI